MRPRTEGIVETCLYVEDTARSRTFYERIFGFPAMIADDRLVALDAGPRHVLLLFKRRATLAPIPVGKGFIPPHDGGGPQHVAFAIPASAWDGWKDHLAGENVALESEVDWPQGGRSLNFRDPDGLLVELVTPGIWVNY